jgi:hypothetical protein
MYSLRKHINKTLVQKYLQKPLNANDLKKPWTQVLEEEYSFPFYFELLSSASPTRYMHQPFLRQTKKK